jgi:hypothetical protein
MKKQKSTCSVLALLALSLCLVFPSQLLAEDETVQWINHLDFLPGDSVISAEYNSAIGFGGWLQITSAEEVADATILQVLQVPAGYLVNGVRVCYTVTGDNYISGALISQLQAPPYDADIVLFERAMLDSMDPVCVNIVPQRSVPIDPSLGALTLRFGVSFANTTDSIVINGVGLLTVPDPNSPVMQLEDDVEKLEDDVEKLNSNIERIAAVLIEHGMRLDALEQNSDRLTNFLKTHTHIYLTGKGVGHNNVEAVSSTYSLESETPAPKPPVAVESEPPAPKPPVAEKKSKKKKKK